MIPEYRLSYWINISGGEKCWNACVTRVTSVGSCTSVGSTESKIESNEMIGTSERFARKSFNKLNNKPIKMLLGSASVTFSYLKIICIRGYNECWYVGPKQFIDFFRNDSEVKCELQLGWTSSNHKPKVFKIEKKSETFPSERSVTRLLRSLNDFVYINKTSQNRLNRKIIILSSG